MERLVRKNEFKAARPFINSLRAKSDPPPQLLAPPGEIDGMRTRECVLNSVKYCENNPGYEPVMGFKLWTMDFCGKLGMGTPYVAMVHVVVLNKQSGKYMDVTPPDAGDENQPLIFVPSSRLYPTWTAAQIAHLCATGLEPRMGSICRGAILEFKHMREGPDLCKSTPEDLELLMCPKIATVAELLAGAGVDASVCDHAIKKGGGKFAQRGATVVELEGERYFLMVADVYRALFSEMVPRFV